MLDTEIDWKTYMQFADYFTHGTMDYGKLQGETGFLSHFWTDP